MSHFEHTESDDGLRANNDSIEEVMLIVTVAILAQGTHWAVADMQAFLVMHVNGRGSLAESQSDSQCHICSRLGMRCADRVYRIGHVDICSIPSPQAATV